MLSAAEPQIVRRVALVFDDGPVPALCSQFLETFRREGVSVTFSHVGSNVAAHPDLSRAVAKAGHEIANHSYTHPHFKGLPPAVMKKELLDTQAAITAATGRTPRWMWTPFLDWDDSIAAVHRELQLQHMPLSQLHLVSTDDWNRAVPAEKIFQNATTGIEDRTVILCHETREDTLIQLPRIIADLRRQGCEFLTFSQLADTLNPEARTVIH